MSLSRDDAFRSPSAPSLEEAVERLRQRWGWLVAFGTLASLLGFLALALTTYATVFAVYMIAFFMILVGGTEIVLGVNSHVWSSRLLLVLLGLFYVVAGAFALANPLTGAAAFTLLLGASLLATGLVRVYFGFKLPHGPIGFVVFAGLITTLLGLLILFGWPENSPFILGIFLGVDLLFYDGSWIGFGLFLRPR
jgi:uncharacterized membrane protein HdeD (DUF308 family)